MRLSLMQNYTRTFRIILLSRCIDRTRYCTVYAVIVGCTRILRVTHYYRWSLRGSGPAPEMNEVIHDMHMALFRVRYGFISAQISEIFHEPLGE